MGSVGQIQFIIIHLANGHIITVFHIATKILIASEEQFNQCTLPIATTARFIRFHPQRFKTIRFIHRYFA